MVQLKNALHKNYFFRIIGLLLCYGNYTPVLQAMHQETPENLEQQWRAHEDRLVQQVRDTGEIPSPEAIQSHARGSQRHLAQLLALITTTRNDDDPTADKRIKELIGALQYTQLKIDNPSATLGNWSLEVNRGQTIRSHEKEFQALAIIAERQQDDLDSKLASNASQAALESSLHALKQSLEKQKSLLESIKAVGQLTGTQERIQAIQADIQRNEERVAQAIKKEPSLEQSVRTVEILSQQINETERVQESPAKLYDLQKKLLDELINLQEQAQSTPGASLPTVLYGQREYDLNDPTHFDAIIESLAIDSDRTRSKFDYDWVVTRMNSAIGPIDGSSSLNRFFLENSKRPKPTNATLATMGLRKLREKINFQDLIIERLEFINRHIQALPEEYLSKINTICISYNIQDNTCKTERTVTPATIESLIAAIRTSKQELQTAVSEYRELEQKARAYLQQLARANPFAQARTDTEVNRQYKKLILEWHPDKFGGVGGKEDLAAQINHKLNEYREITIQQIKDRVSAQRIDPYIQHLGQLFGSIAAQSPLQALFAPAFTLPQPLPPLPEGVTLVEIVQHLLRLGWPVAGVSFAGYPLLSLAIIKVLKAPTKTAAADALEALRLLLRQPDIGLNSLSTAPDDNFNLNPLMIAIRDTNTEHTAMRHTIIKELIDAVQQAIVTPTFVRPAEQVDINYQIPFSNNTALMLAVSICDVDTVKALLARKDLNRNLTNYQGKTARDLALEKRTDPLYKDELSCKEINELLAPREEA